MVCLRELVVVRFRQVEPGARLRFGAGVNVLLGRNGTGKTTLLELIGMVLRADFSPLAAAPEGAEVSFVMQAGEVEVSAELVVQERRPAKRLPEWTAELQVRKAGAPLGQMSGRSANGGGTWELTGEDRTGLLFGGDLLAPGIFSQLGWFGVVDLDERHDDAARTLRALLEVWGLGSERRRVRFDEGLDLYRALVGEAALPGYQSGLRLPGFPDDSPNTPKTVFDSFLASPVQRSLRVSREERGGEPTLTAMVSVLEMSAVTVKPRIDTSRVSDPSQWSASAWDFELTRPDGLTVGHAGLSYGQKRMLAFLWHLGCNPEGPILADELVNGFHHAWIESVVEQLGDRQAFVACQNPLLIDNLGFDEAAEVAQAFVLCVADASTAGRVTWQWRNPTDTESEGFFSAYGVGIQHVSEVLRSKGLW